MMHGRPPNRVEAVEQVACLHAAWQGKAGGRGPLSTSFMYEQGM
jgi:hypothetical protein